MGECPRRLCCLQSRPGTSWHRFNFVEDAASGLGCHDRARNKRKNPRTGAMLTPRLMSNGQALARGNWRCTAQIWTTSRKRSIRDRCTSHRLRSVLLAASAASDGFQHCRGGFSLLPKSAASNSCVARLFDRAFNRSIDPGEPAARKEHRPKRISRQWFALAQPLAALRDTSALFNSRSAIPTRCPLAHCSDALLSSVM